MGLLQNFLELTMNKTWRDYSRQFDNFVGGELESHEDGSVFRGPIEKIEIKDDYVIITLKWCARMPSFSDSDFGKWTFCKAPAVFSVNISLDPSDIGDGRLSCLICHDFLFILFPKTGSKLDPSKVEGLTIP